MCSSFTISYFPPHLLPFALPFLPYLDPAYLVASDSRHQTATIQHNFFRDKQESAIIDWSLKELYTEESRENTHFPNKLIIYYLALMWLSYLYIYLCRATRRAPSHRTTHHNSRRLLVTHATSQIVVLWYSTAYYLLDDHHNSNSLHHMVSQSVTHTHYRGDDYRMHFGFVVARRPPFHVYVCGWGWCLQNSPTNRNYKTSQRQIQEPKSKNCIQVGNMQIVNAKYYVSHI